MAINRKIFIIIPAFNEASIIKDVITDIQENGYTNIVVVNDGSTDNMQSIASLKGAEIISHATNRGQGASLRTGIKYVQEKYDPDIIVTFDADGQHIAKNIPNMIEPLLTSSADIVLGSRFLKKNTMPWIRKIILKIAVFFTNKLSGIHLTDTHNGFRALGRKAATLIQIRHDGMEHASDIIDEITRNKLQYIEVPVDIIYSEYSLKKGQQNSDLIRMGFKLLIEKIIK